VKRLIQEYGGRFSTALGIYLLSGDPKEIFKWFLASVLFGARISETIVTHTYKKFEQERVLTPEGILATGWDGLVAILDSRGYVRYDFKTATKLLDMSRSLTEKYSGDLTRLHDDSLDPRDLEERLRGSAKGIGDVTVNIFLREMRGIWTKADPLPSDLVIAAAREMGYIPPGLRDKRKILDQLMKKWTEAGMRRKDFADFEAALVRIGKAHRRKVA
jgi:endonuclease III